MPTHRWRLSRAALASGSTAPALVVAEAFRLRCPRQQESVRWRCSSPVQKQLEHEIQHHQSHDGQHDIDNRQHRSAPPKIQQRCQGAAIVMLRAPCALLLSGHSGLRHRQARRALSRSPRPLQRNHARHSLALSRHRRTSSASTSKGKAKLTMKDLRRGRARGLETRSKRPQPLAC